MKSDIFFGLGLFKRLQDLVSNFDGVGEALQPRSKLLKFVVSEVTVRAPVARMR